MKENFLFIHSVYFYNVSSSPLLLRGASDTASMDTVAEFHAEAPQAIVSEILAQGSYVAAARVGFEPATLRTKGIESTNAPPRPKIDM